MAKAKAPPDSFVLYFNDKPTLEIRWLSEAVFDAVREDVNDWLYLASEHERDELNELVLACVASGCTSDEIDEAIRDYEVRLASCSLHSQTPEQACEHLRSTFPRAVYDLLRLLVKEAYYYVSHDFDKKCLFVHHRPTHYSEDRIVIEELEFMQRKQLQERLDLPYLENRGGKPSKLRTEPETIMTLAKEYENLQTEKSYGDSGDKTLWEIICRRYENADPKWRERAKLDKDDVPDRVLDLVSLRHKLRLKKSHFALYHAATRAKIGFTVSTHARTGKPFIKPSPSTLLRRCAEGARRTQKRTQKPIINAELPV